MRSRIGKSMGRLRGRNRRQPGYPEEQNRTWLKRANHRIGYMSRSFIRHRITPLNVGPSRHLRRRLVAVPACIAGRGRREPVTSEARDRAAHRLFFPAICEVSQRATGTDAWTQAADEREQTSAQVSPTAVATATNLH